METNRDIPTKNSFENSRKTLNRQQKFEVPWCNLRINSSQHNGCGLSNENKPSQIEDTKILADESLLCLKRSRKSDLQATLLPSITRERFTERWNCQDIGQCFVRKMTSIKHTKTVQATKQFCCHQGGKCFTQNSYFNEHMKIHLERKQHCCHECGKKFPVRTT